MDLRIFTEPQQGATYETLLAAALATEASGLDAFFRSDHYLVMGEAPAGAKAGLPGPTDSWVTLGGLARDTERVRLGTLMTSATFRLPGPLAISVAQVDAMSGGRVELGIGAGWYTAEHRAYGIPFPESVSERFDRLEEQLAIISGLWETPFEDTFSFSGRYYELIDSPALPKPAQRPRPPIIVGGRGTRRTPMVAARYADECNVGFGSLDEVRAVFAGLDAACAEIGRDPATVRRSVALVLCLGTNEGECERRAGAIGRELGELRANGLAGTPEEAAQRAAEFAALGASRVYLQVLDLSDLDHIHLAGEALQPLVAGL